MLPPGSLKRGFCFVRVLYQDCSGGDTMYVITAPKSVRGRIAAERTAVLALMAGTSCRPLYTSRLSCQVPLKIWYNERNG